MGGDTLGLQVRGAAPRGRQGGPEGSVPGPRVPCPCPGGFVIGGQGRPMAAGGQLGESRGYGRGCPGPGTLWQSAAPGGVCWTDSNENRATL